MKWQLVVAGLAFGVSLAGQSPSPGSTPAPAGESKQKPSNRIDQRAQSMRDQIELGKTVNIHVRVAVRLKNGNRLLGVVKDGKLVERVDGLRFVDAQAQERGAGIRLWYTGGTRNWVFVPFHDFADYEVLQQLSNKQIQAIEQEMQMAERSAAERQASQPKAGGSKAVEVGQEASGATPPAGDPGDPASIPPVAPDAVGGSVGANATPAPGTSPAAKVPTGVAPGKVGEAAKKPADPAAAPANIEVEKQREWFALLQAYPPAGGWGQEKRDEIARRKVVIGAEPSAAEKNFVARFEEWKKACEHFKVGASPKSGEGSDDVSADDRPSSPRRKKERQQDRQQNNPDEQ